MIKALTPINLSLTSPSKAQIKLLSDELALRKRLYQGDIFCISNTPSINQLIATSREIIQDYCWPANPLHIHEQVDNDKFSAWAQQLRKKYNQDAKIISIFKQILIELNWQTSTDIYYDCLELRIAPPIVTHNKSKLSHVDSHRDTWGSAIDQQINWWAPLWPLAPNRSMGFYPDYWDSPIANSTKEWSLKDYMLACADCSEGQAPDYPSAPLAKEQPKGDQEAVLIEVGSILAFSSAHLHASIPNQSELTRYSIEVRTVSLSDINSGIGAKNIDNASSPPLFGLFKNIQTNQKLKEQLAKSQVE